LGGAGFVVVGFGPPPHPPTPPTPNPQSPIPNVLNYYFIK